jgi:RES domain-containing protein
LTSVYRLLRKPFSATPFDGEGSFRYGGRWSRPGTRVVYTAQHLSLAMIEYLVHLDADRLPRDIMLAKADVPEDVSRMQITTNDLPAGWRSYPPPEALAAIGDAFARELRAAVLIVPSSLAVTDNNWILNPAHPDFHKIKFHSAAPFDYDPRLLKTGR